MVRFKTSKTDGDLIAAITRRALTLVPKLNATDIVMDLTVCHANGNALRLKDLLAAEDFNLLHDVLGIHRFLDRRTGKLGEFEPRFHV